MTAGDAGVVDDDVCLRAAPDDGDRPGEQVALPLMSTIGCAGVAEAEAAGAAAPRRVEDSISMAGALGLLLTRKETSTGPTKE